MPEFTIDTQFLFGSRNRRPISESCTDENVKEAVDPEQTDDVLFVEFDSG